MGLNPVRARMVAQPEDSLWSSSRATMGTRHTPWLDVDLGSHGLGHTARERARRYRALVTDAVPEAKWAPISARYAVRWRSDAIACQGQMALTARLEPAWGWKTIPRPCQIWRSWCVSNQRFPTSESQISACPLANPI
jgi:hypothetical protein